MASEPATREPLDTWLAKMLELPEDASPADSRCALLNRIEEDSFNSDESLLLAIAHLNNEEPAELSRQRVIEWQLRNDVEDFCEGFFDLRPSERREKYRQLCERAAPCPGLKRRLLKLQPGLSINRDSLQTRDERATQLIQTILELFVMSPLEQTYRHREKIASFKKEPARWKAPALVVRRRFAEISRLQPHFLNLIGAAAPGQAPADTSKGEDIATAAAPTDVVYQQTFHAGDLHSHRARRNTGSRLPLFALLAIVVPVIAVVYGVMLVADNPNTIAMTTDAEFTTPANARPSQNALTPLPGIPLAGTAESGAAPELKFEPGEMLRQQLQMDAARTGQPERPQATDIVETFVKEQRASIAPDSPAEIGEAMISLRDSLFVERGFNGNLDPTETAIANRPGLVKSDLTRHVGELLEEYTKLTRAGHEFTKDENKAAKDLRKYIIFKAAVKDIVLPRDD